MEKKSVGEKPVFLDETGNQRRHGADGSWMSLNTASFTRVRT
jgi:hypothetical protein